MRLNPIDLATNPDSYWVYASIDLFVDRLGSLFYCHDRTDILLLFPFYLVRLNEGIVKINKLW
jgi:hypothetical protein